MSTDKPLRYSVIGLGKLGASMAGAIAKRGFEVIGVDVNRNAVDRVNEGHAPVQETNLEETIHANRARIRATMSHVDAVLNTDLSFVIVPTPSDERGAFSLQYAAWAFKEIGKALKEKKGYHNVVLTSTVLPGSTRYGLMPILERESGKKCGPDFGLCYSPEFIALGSILRDFLNPDFTLVGEVDDRAGAMLEASYAKIMENNPPCARMSFENAELTKISVNTFVTTKITFANMLADICERIPGGNVDVVTRALGMDKRIGGKYLKGALGYGGPCFPRDNVALSFLARAVGTRADLAETTDRLNRSLAAKVVQALKARLRPGVTVAVLGLSYKPHSHVIEESQGVQIVRALSDAGFRVLACDPLAADGARAELKDHVVILDAPARCLEQAEAALITTPDPAFAQLDASHFTRPGIRMTVVDFWRLLADKLAKHPGCDYVPFGCGAPEAGADLLRGLWGAVKA